VPNVQRHAPAHEQIRDLAIDARREGICFDEFWERAIRPGAKPRVNVETQDPPPTAVVWPRDSYECANALAAAAASKDTWRRAYDLEPPTPGDRALAILAGIVKEEAGGSEAGVALASAA